LPAARGIVHVFLPGSTYSAAMAEGPVHSPDAAGGAPAVHPLYVRITHWINALAMFVMIGSGWLIYNASPLFPFTFPMSITLGRGLAGALLLHFAAMWVLLGNGLLYVALSLARGRFRTRLLPIRGAELADELRAALGGRLRRDDPARYNAVQKLFYVAVLVAGAISVASGFAIWKPVQLRELAALFGGYEGARLVHFFAMATIALFLCVHVVMAVLVPRTLRAMIRGR
jgi:thiosulfate reductase cytochrome b subunit